MAAESSAKTTNAFMVLRNVQLLTVIDTVHLVNQSFEIPADQVPEISYEYDQLIVNCSEGTFTEDVLYDAAKKAINKVDIHQLKSLRLEQSKSLFSGFQNVLKDVEITNSCSLHSVTINRFLKLQLVSGRLERLVLHNSECNLTALEEEISRFLWQRTDSELKIILDEPIEEECLSFDILNAFVEMTFTRHFKTKRRKIAEVYVNHPKQHVINEIGNRDFSREILRVNAEAVPNRFSNFCKLVLCCAFGR